MGIEASISTSITTVLNSGDEVGPQPPVIGPSLNFSLVSNSMYVPVMGF